MAEKQATNKELRHESAKTKYQHYQRVLSCKNLMKNVAPITPSPGQFIVENNKPVQLPVLNESKSYSILLTKNIKSIVQKTNPVPFSEMLSEVVSKKTLKVSATEKNRLKKQIATRHKIEGQNQPYFKRPISAKIYHETEGKQIEQSQMLKQAFEYDRKVRLSQESLRKNYFQVRPKLKIPKHIHGYNTIVIQQKSLLPSQNIGEELLANEVEKQLSSLNYKSEKNFLPTEYYFNQPLKPSQLIERYKNQNDIIFGFSKWFHNDGKSSWRRCRILRYDESEQRWEIQWLGSGIAKKVSRNNLYFEKENFDEFQKAVDAAEEFRKRSEIYMKYNILIGLINTPTPGLSEQSQQKIKFLTNFVVPKESKGQLIKCQGDLLQQAKQMHTRACHQFQFNAMLPYNTACKKMFGGVFPQQMFNPNPRQMMVDEGSKIEFASRAQFSQIFNSGLKKIKQKCFLNSQKKIKILELINIMNEQLSSIDLLKDYKKLDQKNYSVDQINTILNRNISEYFYKINCRICDIEHLVSKELDPLYANKKLIPEEIYNSTISRYEKFLKLANMKIQIFLRQSTINVINSLTRVLPSFKTCSKTVCGSGINWDVIFLQQNQQLKITVQIGIKDEKLQISPSPSQLSTTILKNVERIITELKSIKCISKTYLQEIRPNNILQVVSPNYDTQQIEDLNSTIDNLKAKLSVIQTNFQKYFSTLAHRVGQIFELNSQIAKRSQKKNNSYGEIEQIIEKINQCQIEIKKMIKIEQFDLCGIFKMNFQEVKSKVSTQISQTMKEVVSMLIEKIYKDNQKMDKNVTSMLETMLKVPNTIAEFVELEAFVTENVKQEIQKSHAKAKMLTEKMNILEKTSQIIEYRDFQSCCQIYLKPLKLQKAREEVMFKLQNVYKKNFAEELMKDSYSVLDNIKICEKMFTDCLCSKTLEEMDKNFNVFSQLNASIQGSCQKMSSINEKQVLLKWSKTNFDRLLQVKQEFQPYYKLITLHKNYRLNLLPLFDEAFTQINYQIISQNVASSFDTLKFLSTHKFNGNQIYEPITQSILKEYEEFNTYLPLIKALRNPDLRERHWVIIENITGESQIRGDSITLKEILSQTIRNQSEELYKISQIATKELIYEKSLNQLRKQWKDVRVTIKEIKIGNETYKFIKNIAEIEKKLQNDMLEVNNILASSFIKFLEADVTHWKSLVLQKVYEFVNYWPGLESKIIFYLRLFNSSKMSQYFQSTSTAHKNLQKCWKQFMTNSEYQSVIVDIVSTRAWQTINTLEFQMEEIQRIISEFLEQKKKMNSKLRLFSDDALISMMVESNSEFALEGMKKCFTGAKSFKFIEEAGCQNIQIMSTLNEKIVVVLENRCSKTQIKTEKNLSLYTTKDLNETKLFQFDDLLLSIDKQLKKQIKNTFLSSLQEEVNENDLLCQVQLLKCRLVFKNKLEGLLLAGKSLDAYELEITSEQRQMISNIRNCRRQMKVLSLHIIQLINQINMIQRLSQIDNPISSFEWYKYPKYELAESTSINNPKLKLNIGAYTREYLFQLVQCQSFIANPMNDSAFVNICTSLEDRMLPLLQGNPGSSRIMYLKYFGELLGRNVTEVACSELTSPGNLLQYLKIASSGLFIILSELQILSLECLSVFNQTLSTFWLNYQLSRININSFKLKSEEFILDVPNFTLVGICTIDQPFQNVGSFRQCFRTFHMVPIQSQFLLKCSLLSTGISQISDSLAKNVRSILQELNYQRIQGNLLGINKNTFMWQISHQFLSNCKQKRSENQQQLLQKSIQEVLQMYLPFEENSESKIWKDLFQLKLINKSKSILFKKIDLSQKQLSFDSEEISSVKNLQTMKTLLEFHCGVIVIGPTLSGKSFLINKLIQSEGSKKFNFCSVNPKAYTIQELYEGNNQKQGIIRQMIDQIKMKASGLQLQAEVVNGLYFDSQIGGWTDPLLSVVDKPQDSRLSFPDGSLLNLSPSFKLVFQTNSLATMSPNSFHSIGILKLESQISWKALLSHYFKKYFSNLFEQSANAQFIKCLLLQTFDPALQFYQSIHKQKPLSNSEQIIIGNPIILESFMKFFSLIYHKQDVGKISNFNEQVQPHKEAEEKIKSEILNIYTYSLLATLGHLIPQQSRKTFSRHFKYVLEQSHLGRYGWKNNSILNKDEESIYDFFYEKGQWCKWKSQKSLNFSDSIIIGHYRVLQKVLQHHIQYGNSCFLIGQECSSKNYVFKNYIAQLKTEKYTKNYFICSRLTQKHNISNKITEMIYVQKYSRKINGFSNCKKNLIYIQDLNMANRENLNDQNGSILQFIKEFYRQRTWYIEGDLYGFCNVQFYGTLNQNLKMPTHMFRYLNPILMSQPENRIQSILEDNIRSSPLSSFEKQLVIRCTLNLQEVLIRDLAQNSVTKEKQSFINSFNLRDMVRVVRGICKITQNISNLNSLTMHSLLRFWVYVVDNVYSQKISYQRKDFLFYLINNVLMEEERVRYRTICPSSNFYVVGFKESFVSCKTIKQSYQTLTAQELSQKLKKIFASAPQKYRYACMFLNENCLQLIKTLVKLANSLEFESKIVVIFNEERKKMTPILKMLGLINHSMVHQAHCQRINEGIQRKDEFKIEKDLNMSFTKAYYDHFGNPEATASKYSSAFQSQFQSKTKIDNQFDEKAQNDYKNKNRVIYHIKNAQSKLESQEIQNFILQDLLSYRKLNKYPKWMIPKQESQDDLPELSQTSIGNRKNFIFQKYLTNQDTQQIAKEAQQRQKLCREMDISIILQYYSTPNYLLKNYSSLIGESSIVFLRNPCPQPALIERSNKVMMTDVKIQEVPEDISLENIDLKRCSPQELAKMAAVYGPKVYIDVIFDVLRQRFDQNWHSYIANKPMAFKESFRAIFSQFSRISFEISTRKAKVSQHLEKTINMAQAEKEKLETAKKQQLFILNQNDLKLGEVKTKIEKQGQKYWSQKKKLAQIKQKLQKKQKQYEENLIYYRQAMDKFSFQFSKAKDKIMKTIISLESGKSNIMNNLTIQNKLMIEGLSCVLYIVDLKKTEDIGMLALRQFTKLLKDKKISKILAKTTIESIPSKALGKIEKIVQQIQSKNQDQKAQNDENSLLQEDMSQFLKICLISGKQFNHPKVTQFYDNIQNAGKSIDKLKADQTKKQKSKANKQLFENYDIFTQENLKLQQKAKETTNKIQQLSLILAQLEKFSKNLPKLITKMKKQTQNQGENQSSAVVMAICLRYFNQLFNLSGPQLQKLFSDLQAALQPYQIPATINSLPNLKELPLKTMTDSLFNFRGFILIQSSKQKNSPHYQNQQVLSELIFQGRNLKRIKYSSFIQTSEKSNSSNANAILIAVEEFNQKQCLEKIEKILSLKDVSQIAKLIFIEAEYFSEQQKCNYPYVDFITGQGVSLSYQYVHQKCKSVLFESMARNKIIQKVQNGLETKRKIIQHGNNYDVISEFMAFNLEITDNLQNLKKNCQQLNQILAPLQNETEEIVKSNPQSQINITESTITDKQKQKQFFEHKTCQFFTKLFLIQQNLSRNGKSQPIALEYYLESVHKIIKSLPNSNLASHPESTSYKYITRLNKELSQFIAPMQTTLIMNLICNARMNLFGNVSHYERYVGLFVEQACRKGDTAQVDSEEAWKQSVKKAVQKLKTYVPSLNPICDQVALDFQFWTQDINNLYKEQKEPPVQWLYLMLVADKNRFWDLINKVERKVIEKMSNDPDFYDHSSVAELLDIALAPAGKNTVNVVTPIFVQSYHSFHDVANTIQAKKLDFQFLDLKKFMEKQKARLSSTIQSRKSQKSFQQQIQMQSNKLFISFVRSSQVSLVNDFVKHMQLKYQQKRSKSGPQQQTPQIKLIILNSENYPHQPLPLPIKNSVVIKEMSKCQLNNLFGLYQAPIKYYNSVLKDKTKLRQHQLLPAKTRRAIYEVFLVVCEAVAGLSLPNNFDFHHLIQRCLKIAQKLSRYSKNNKASQKQSSNWKSALKQILYQYSPYQTSLIDSKWKKMEQQSVRMIEDGQQKYVNVVRQSESYRRLFRICVGNLLGQYTGYFGKQENYVQANQSSYLGNIDQLLYRLRRQYSKQYYLPIHNILSIAQLIPAQLANPNTHKLTTIYMRNQLQHPHIQQTNNYIVQISVIREEDQTKLTKTKGIIVEDGTNRGYVLYVREEIFLTNFINYGMGETQYIVDYPLRSIAAESSIKQ